MSTSPRLPPEICHHIIDQLCDQPDVLKTCSVVSKSWTAQSQKHIFSNIRFSDDPDVVAWRNAFPDPANSPACHARTLIVNHPKGFPENHLSSFCNVTHMVLHVHVADGRVVSLAQLHGFTPFLKSLLVTFPVRLPPTDILNLVCSFPLLDDLLLIGSFIGFDDAKVTPSIAPRFSGRLYLAVPQGMRIMANHLLSLRGGLHFRQVILPWICDEDWPPMMDLVSACSCTLESLQVLNHSKQGNTRHVLDLSSALNLKSVELHCGIPSFDIDWIRVAVESIRSPHVKKITLHMPTDITTRESIETHLPSAVYAQWLDLDRALVKYLTTRSFRLRVVASTVVDGGVFEVCVEHLLPNSFGKGMLEVAQIVRT